MHNLTLIWVWGNLKNGAVVRKHMGYTHIAAPHAAAIETFYEEHFNGSG